MMQYNFELKLNVVNETEKPFSSSDIAIILNKAQDIIVNDRYSSSVLSPRHFEMDEKTRVEIGKLITNHTVSSFATGANRIQKNSVFASLPANYLYSITEQGVVGYTDANSDVVTGPAKVIPITHDEYLINRDNPFNKPNEKTLWRMDYSGDSTGSKKHELLFAEDQSIISYQLRYIRRPREIDIVNGIDCELHPGLHEELIDLAVRIGKEILNGTTKLTPQ